MRKLIVKRLVQALIGLTLPLQVMGANFNVTGTSASPTLINPFSYTTATTFTNEFVASPTTQGYGRGNNNASSPIFAISANNANVRFLGQDIGSNTGILTVYNSTITSQPMFVFNSTATNFTLQITRAAVAQVGGTGEVFRINAPGTITISGSTSNVDNYPQIRGNVQLNNNSTVTANFSGTGILLNGRRTGMLGNIVGDGSNTNLTLGMNAAMCLVGDIISVGTVTVNITQNGSVVGNITNATTATVTLASTSNGSIGNITAVTANVNLNANSTGSVGDIGTTHPSGSTTAVIAGSGSINSIGATIATITLSSNGNITNNVNTTGAATINLNAAGRINGSVNIGSGSVVNIRSSGYIGGNLTINGAGNLTIYNTSTTGAKINVFGGQTTAVNITGAGNLQMNGPGSISGNVILGGGSTVNFTSSGIISGNLTTGSVSNITVNSAGSVSGSIDGTSSSTLTVNNTWTPTAGQTISGISTLNVSAGTFTPSSTMDIPTAINVTGATLTLNYKITGTANTTIIEGGGSPGTINILVADGLNTTGTLTLNTNSRIYVYANWTKSNTITTANPSSFNFLPSPPATSVTFTNTGTFNVSTGFIMQRYGNYTNAGILNYDTTNNSAFSFTGTFTNSGTFNVNQNMTATQTFTNTGNISLASGRTLTLSGNVVTMVGGTISGAGDLVFGSGTTTNFYNASIQNTGSRDNYGVFNMFDGSISGVASFTNRSGSTFNYYSGTISSPFTLSGSSALNVNGNLTLTAALNNFGTITIETSKSLTTSALSASGFTYNYGTLTTNGLFTNTGFVYTGPTGTTTINAGMANNVAGTLYNAGTTIINSAISGVGTTTNISNLYINSGGSITGQTFNNGSNGIIYVNGTGSILNVINASGSSGYTNNALIFGRTTSGTFTLGNNVTDVRSISLENNSILTVSGAITGVNTAFTVSSGSTATFTNTLSGTGVINNSGTMNFNSGATLNNFSAINMYNNSILSFNSGVKTISVTNITGVSGNTGSKLYIGPTDATTVQTSGTIQDIRLIQIYSGSTLRLNSGAKITSTNGSNIVTINGTLDVDPGSFFTVNESDAITGTGNVINGGLFTVNGANLSLGGNFTNEASGVFKVTGTPTITFSGPTFSSEGEINATFNTSNNLPFINLINATSVDLSKGNVIIGYQQNYIAAGNYTLLTAASVPTLGGFMTPPASTYISSMTLQVIGNSVVVNVVRDGFGNHALTEKAQLIGNFLEYIGSNSPTQAQLDLLNALEKISDSQLLTEALESLLPPDYNQQINLQMQQAMMGAVFLRLAHQRMVGDYGSIADMGYASGDEDPENAVWIRPFYASGHQRPVGSQIGYNSKTNGVILGFDKQISAPLMLGVAANYANSNAYNTSNTATKTNIKNYQATFYGTYKAGTTYLDGLLSAGVNRYVTTRNIALPDYNEDAYSNYSSQQFTAKVKVSRDVVLTKYLQFTPEASAQYSFIRQLAYTETGAGPYNVYTNPDNTNLFRLGTGAKFSVPMSEGKILSIPGVYALAFVDVAGGAQDANSQFISGGPIISNSVQPSRWMLVFGLSYEFSLSDNIQIIANYDVEVRKGFNGQEAFLNLRYLF